MDVILLYRHYNLNTVHCLSPTLLSASSVETHSAYLMNYRTTFGYVVWIQTENRPTCCFASRGTAVDKTSALTSSFHILSNSLFPLIRSADIYGLRHRHSLSVKYEDRWNWVVSLRLRQLYSQWKRHLFLLDWRLGRPQRLFGYCRGDGAFRLCWEHYSYSPVLQRVLFTVVAELLRFHFSTVGLLTMTHCTPWTFHHQ